jgi:hypothetical protein
VLVDLTTQTLRIAPERIASVKEELVAPTGREGLQHVLGTLRYYWCVKNHKLMLKTAVLQELDKPYKDINEAWAERHDDALANAINAIVVGDFLAYSIRPSTTAR